MSNEPTIDQMNGVISEFMGYYHEGMDPDYSQYACNAFVADAKYHTSWDWLMEAWDRFRAVVSDYFDEDYPAEYCAMCDIWSLHCEHVNINGAHKLLFDAITWFNECQNELLNRDYNRVIATEFKNKP